MPNIDDGTSDHHGSIETRCWSYGGKNNLRNTHVPQDQTHNAGVRLSEGHHNAQSM